MNRIPIGKRVRFKIFARDGFTCRYCGRQSDSVVLHIDHITPVCQGGTNDEENLLTSCADCNLGKAGKTISQTVPTEFDRLAAAQEMQEQIEASKRATASAAARRQRKQLLRDFWMTETGRNSIDSSSFETVFSYVEEFGDETVCLWIEKAAAKCHNDMSMGKYVSGIRRIEKALQEDQL